jgi:hypothetical protein
MLVYCLVMVFGGLCAHMIFACQVNLRRFNIYQIYLSHSFGFEAVFVCIGARITQGKQ